MWTKFNTTVRNVREGKDVSDSNLKLAMGAVALSILYKSWQRPGVVANLSVSEFEAAVKVEDTFCISVREHKTGLLGPARLLADLDTMTRMRQAINLKLSMEL